mmetsp:Transcript_17714/g.40654  ORF Transcript_17714/g.40654 Transcript_17714/m.40654 type:complete len:313 (-) Transcript_17714:304-1242(-)
MNLLLPLLLLECLDLCLQCRARVGSPQRRQGIGSAVLLQLLLLLLEHELKNGVFANDVLPGSGELRSRSSRRGRREALHFFQLLSLLHLLHLLQLLFSKQLLDLSEVVASGTAEAGQAAAEVATTLQREQISEPREARCISRPQRGTVRCLFVGAVGRVVHQQVSGSFLGGFGRLFLLLLLLNSLPHLRQQSHGMEGIVLIDVRRLGQFRRRQQRNRARGEPPQSVGAERRGRSQSDAGETPVPRQGRAWREIRVQHGATETAAAAGQESERRRSSGHRSWRGGRTVGGSGKGSQSTTRGTIGNTVVGTVSR